MFLPPTSQTDFFKRLGEIPFVIKCNLSHHPLRYVSHDIKTLSLVSNVLETTLPLFLRWICNETLKFSIPKAKLSRVVIHIERVLDITFGIIQRCPMTWTMRMRRGEIVWISTVGKTTDIPECSN